MSNPSPITDIAGTIRESRTFGMSPRVVKMTAATLQFIFDSEEGREIASKYVPTANTLGKAISGMVKSRIRVELSDDCAPDKVYIQS